MKSIVLFLAVTLILTSCKTEQKRVVPESKNEYGMRVEKTIGIGRLQVSLNEPIPLYRTAQDMTPFDTLLFSRHNAGEEKGSFIVERASGDTLNPMSFYKGDSEEEANSNINSGLVYFAPQLVFRMTALAEGGFEVVLDEGTFEVALVKQDELHILYTQGEPYWQMEHNSSEYDSPWLLCELWEDYFKRVLSIHLDRPQVYDTINGSIKYSSVYYAYFEVDTLVGEWAKVRKQSAYWEEDDKFPNEGWIKWAEGETLLVDPIEEGYE